MFAPNKDSFVFMNHASSVKYLALEGGGGKGTVFLGAIQVLEHLKKLPLNKKFKEENKSTILDGVSGASAGAITAYLLALGCNSTQIKYEMDNFDFNKFYEPPLPGVYKTVKQKNGRNQFFMATDKISRITRFEVPGVSHQPTGRQVRVKKQATKVEYAGHEFKSLNDALKQGKTNHRHYKNMFYHKRFLESFIGNMIVSNAIYSFLLGAIRTITNGYFIKLILSEIDKGNKIPLIKKWKDLQEKNSNDQKNIDKILLGGGNFTLGKIFHYLIKLPFWKAYSFFATNRKTKSQVLSNNFFQLLANDKLDDYLDCIKFERAAYSGIEVRNFFTNATIVYLIENFDVYIDHSSIYETLDSKISEGLDIVEIETGKAQEIEFPKITGESKEILKEYYSFLSTDSLSKLTSQSSIKATQKQITIDEVINITYQEFFNLTGNDFKIVTTNMTKGMPCIFSKEITPEFPAIDAICMSMSIPMVFKPTFVHPTVKVNKIAVNNQITVPITQQIIDERDYHGFHVDGGMLTNLPIHLFDEQSSSKNTLNSHVLGIRLSDGYPKEKYPETKEDNYSLYDKDPLHEKHVSNYFKFASKKRNNDSDDKNDTNSKYFFDTNRYKYSDAIDYFNGSGGLILDYLGNTLNTGIFYQGEEGQFRYPEERQQALELFCYPIGIFTFAPDEKTNMVKEAFQFAQARAVLKTAAWMGVKFEDVLYIVKEYYKDVMDVRDESDKWIKLKLQLKIFYGSC